MHDDSMKLLEERVLGAVERIQELKTENDRLRRTKDDLEGQVSELRDRCETAQRELGAVQDRAETAAHLEDRRRIIEEKVGGLLEKLDAIE